LETDKTLNANVVNFAFGKARNKRAIVSSHYSEGLEPPREQVTEDHLFKIKKEADPFGIAFTAIWGDEYRPENCNKLTK